MNFIIIIVVLILLVVLSNNNNNDNSLQIKKPVHKDYSLLESLTNISAADKVTLKNITEKWSLTKDVIDEDLKHKLLQLIPNLFVTLILSFEILHQTKFQILLIM